MKTKILAIAPYEGMKETMSALVKNRTDIELTVEVGNLEHGLAIVKEKEQNCFDIIISRGGTAQLIAASTSIPVVEVSISVYDILRAIKLAENYTDKYAVAAYSPITDSARILCDLLQLDIDIYTIDETSDVLSLMQSLRAKGYGLVLCDTIGTLTASEAGLNYILITSGSESIEAAVRHAVELSSAISFQKTRYECLDAALKHSAEDLFIYQTNGALVYCSAEHGLEETLEAAVKKHFTAFLKKDPYILELSSGDVLHTFRGHLQTLKGEPYLYLYLSTRSLPSCVETDSNPLSGLDPDIESDLTYYNGGANNIGNTRNELEKYAKSSYPLLIIGEPGTGKDKSAVFIHRKSAFSGRPLFTVNCTGISAKKWKDFLESENSPLYESHVTIYFKNIQDLSAECSEKLSAILIQSQVAGRNRLLFSYVQDSGGSFQENRLVHDLTDKLSCLLLRTLPLRERKEDIKSIATVYISQLNMELGRQIVGFQPEAMDALIGFDWKYNLDQFRRVLRELAVQTEGFYIEASLVDHILAQETPGEHLKLPTGYEAVNVNQTMEEINRSVLRILLEKQGMSQSKAAEKLGISRSTLWRMLKG